MSRLRMASGMAAAFVDAASGPTSAVFGFVRAVVRVVVCGLFSGLWIAVKAVWKVFRVILPWLTLAAAIAGFSYLGYLFVCSWVAQAKIAALATRHETAFNESLEAAVESADDLEINARVRAMVDSRLAVSGDAEHGSPAWSEMFSSLEGVPAENMGYWMLTVMSDEPAARLMVMRSMDTGREYVSVEVDGQQAYLCVVENGEGLWPWVYRGVGLWEHLLDMTESFVDRDRQRREIDSRFGNLEEAR